MTFVGLEKFWVNTEQGMARAGNDGLDKLILALRLLVRPYDAW